MTQKRKKIKERCKILGYIEWLKREAERGNIPAIFALRRRGVVAPALANITARDLRSVKTIAAKITHVTGRGTLFYKSGEDIFRDNGSHLSLKKDITDDGVKTALQIAIAKFAGQPIMVNGSDELKERFIQAAIRGNIRVTFADPVMEKRKMELFNAAVYIKRTAQDKTFNPGNRHSRNEKKPDAPVQSSKRKGPER